MLAVGSVATYAAAAARSSIASLALRAADAISSGRAHVESSFLAGDLLERSRAEMIGTLATLPQRFDFESIETDLLNREFRRSAAGPLPFAALLDDIDELQAALAESTG